MIDKMDKIKGRCQKILVLGLGTVGFSTAKYFTQFKKFDVYGFDISSKAVKQAMLHGINSDTIWEKLPVADIYIICVSTGFKDKYPDMRQIFDVGKKIKHHLNGNNSPLISVESTVIPGTCRKLYLDLNESIDLVHVPHRFWSQDSINYGVKQKRILGALNKVSQTRGVLLYSSVEIPIHLVSNVEIAEIAKITENAYRFVEIAFAEELFMICKKNDIDFKELRIACNTLVRKTDKEDWRVKILEARDGIGGHCLPKDIRYLLSLDSDSKLIKGAIATDKHYKQKFSKS